MSENFFYIDQKESKFITYLDLIKDLDQKTKFTNVVKGGDAYSVFSELLFALIHNRSLVLAEEWLNIDQKKVLPHDEHNFIKTNSKLTIEDLPEIIRKNENSKIILYTSGTTGTPKPAVHTVESLTRFVKIGPRYKNKVWGLTYSPVHIAGLQVFFQAFMNLNAIVNLYQYPKDQIFEVLNQYKITHLSGTPTFYKLLFPSENVFDFVENVTFGGEKLDNALINKVKRMFPNAKIKNIYASTEFGSLLISENDLYEVPDRIKKYIKILDDQLLIHRSLVNTSFPDMNQNEVKDWYETGDLVEILHENPLRFKFIGRKDNIIKIGGYRVNIVEIEKELEQHPNVTVARIYAKKNSLMGNVLIADVMVNSQISEKEILTFLRSKLPEYKIPRIINFVEKIEITKSGKVTRK